MITLPSDIAQFILDQLGMPEFNGHNSAAYQSVIRHIRKHLHMLSDDFTAHTYSESKYGDAYFAYNFPMNIVKTSIVLNELKRSYPGLICAHQKISILDVGCGEGAALLGCHHVLKQHKGLLYTGIDVSRSMLRRCRTTGEWLKKIDPQVTVRLKLQKISPTFFRKTPRRYDMIIFANSLTEIHKGDSVPVKYIEHIFRCLSDAGILILIEPALKRTSRRLMELRNTIIRQTKHTILLPCLHKEECPLLQIRKNKEWCHQSVVWQPPEYLTFINQDLNREIDRLKYSYLVIARNAYPVAINPGFLVISNLLKEKGRKRCYLCTPDGRVELVRQDKSTSDSNTDFDEVHMGDVVDIKKYIQVKRHYWEIGPTAHLRITHCKDQ
jgi:ribosomal protein RSM22 (predicted rRNA methylase)